MFQLRADGFADKSRTNTVNSLDSTRRCKSTAAAVVESAHVVAGTAPPTYFAASI